MAATDPATMRLPHGAVLFEAITRSGLHSGRMKRLLLAVAVAAAATLTGGLGQALAQTTAGAETTIRGEVVPIRQVPPIYPAIAASARVSGEVEVNVGVGPDGRVESAVIVSGPSLFEAAALDAARKSEFECRRCSAPVTPYSLVFAFRLEDSNQLGADAAQPEQIGPARSRVTVVAPARPIYIIFSSYMVRSAKCLFLWKCGIRWAGFDHYCVRVRSLKCLWLWKCADSCPSSWRD